MLFIKILLGVGLGYVAGALAGAGLVELVSTNTHDRAQEIAMTALLVTGPIGALLGAGIAMLKQPRKARQE